MSINLERKLKRRNERAAKTHCRICHKLVKPEIKALEGVTLQICPVCKNKIDVEKKIKKVAV